MAGKYLLWCVMAHSRGMDDQTDTQTGGSATESNAGERGLDATGVYETGEDVVLYDTEHPLAWVEADNAVELCDMI